MKVLIVDDSAVYRSKIQSALAGESWIEVVGTAGNGKLALEFLEKQSVDVMTLDLEMPVMSGMDTLKKLKERALRPKVIVFSSASRAGSEVTMEALSSGANDFVAKPVGTTGVSPDQLIKSDLIPKLRQFHIVTPAARAPVPTKTWAPKTIETFIPSVVVMASSTGGPAAHDYIFRELSGQLRIPILIAQHMPPVFTTAFARRISNYHGLPCREAVSGEVLENAIYVAPGDNHMVLAKKEGKILVELNKNPPRNSVRPAADPLFETAAQIFGPKCMGFVLTGMGEDGLVGARAVKEAGGGMMIQNQDSCVVFGMPGAVFASGLHDITGNLDQIRNQLKRMVVK